MEPVKDLFSFIGSSLTVESAKDFFFFVGSVLGILAFWRTLIEPAFADNRRKWEMLRDRLAEQDLIDLQYQVYAKRRVNDELLNKVSYLIHDIKQDKEDLRLGPPFRRLFEEHKEKLSKNYWQLIDHIQVPFWEIKAVEDDDTHVNYWKFDKDYFYSELPEAIAESDSKKARRISDRAFENHLNEASDAVDRIRAHYRALGILAKLHVFQAPFARWVVRKQSRLPER